MTFQLTNQASRYYQFTKHFLQYYNLLSTISNSTFVGSASRTASLPESASSQKARQINGLPTVIHISGLSKIKKVHIGHRDWDTIQKQLRDSSDKEISLKCILDAHIGAFSASTRSKKDLWQQFLEYNLVENGNAVRPIPGDAAIIQYFQKHCAEFDENTSALSDYLTNKKQWNYQGVWKSTPEQMQVFKLQDFAKSYSGVELDKKVSNEKLLSARNRWMRWKNRNLQAKELLTSVDHQSLNQFHAFPALAEPRAIIDDQIGLLKRVRAKILRNRTRRARNLKKRSKEQNTKKTAQKTAAEQASNQ